MQQSRMKGALHWLSNAPPMRLQRLAPRQLVEFPFTLVICAPLHAGSWPKWRDLKSSACWRAGIVFAEKLSSSLGLGPELSFYLPPLSSPPILSKASIMTTELPRITHMPSLTFSLFGFDSVASSRTMFKKTFERAPLALVPACRLSYCLEEAQSSGRPTS